MQIPEYVWSEEYQVALLSEHFKAFDKLRKDGYFVGEFIWNFADFKTAQSKLIILIKSYRQLSNSCIHKFCIKVALFFIITPPSSQLKIVFFSCIQNMLQFFKTHSKFIFLSNIQGKIILMYFFSRNIFSYNKYTITDVFRFPKTTSFLSLKVHKILINLIFTCGILGDEIYYWEFNKR